MASELFRLKTARIIDANGISDGAELYFYLTGTTTPTPVYTDAALETAHSNPITVAAGAAVPTIYLDPNVTYRYVVRNAAGEVVDDIDPYTTEPSLVRPAPSGPLIRVDDAFEFGVRLTRYGYNGNGSADNLNVFRDAVEEAEERNIRRIIQPAGVAVVTGSIVDGPLPAGLEFVGEGRRNANEYETGSRIIYTGSDALWSINHPAETTIIHAGWAWRNMAMEASEPGGTIFDFNDTLNTIPDPFGTPKYLQPIVIDRVFLQGGQGGASQTGDGIRGVKVYQLHLTSQTDIRGFRRGIWLKGCDDCLIDCRLTVNTRSIMIERSGDPIQYGTGVQIRSAFIGSAGLEGSEDAYLVWDNGFFTKVFGTNLEAFTGVGDIETALMYLDGFGGYLVPGLMTEAPLFELGPNARNYELVAPRLLAMNTSRRPIFHPPASWDFGERQSDYRIRIVGGNKNAVETIGEHPRIDWVGRPPMSQDIGVSAPVPVDEYASMFADGLGYRPRRRLLTPLNHFGRSTGTIVNGGPELEQDASINNRWVFKLPHDPGNHGLHWTSLIGTDFTIADRVKIRLSVKTASNNWNLYILKNEALHSVPLTNMTGSYDVLSTSISLASGWADGDRFSVAVVNQDGDATAPIYIRWLELSIVDATISDAPTNAPADASTSHALNATFSDTEVEAALNVIATKLNSVATNVNTIAGKVNSLIDHEQARGDMA